MTAQHAPGPWRYDPAMDGIHWTDSASILDAEGGEVAVLTRGYESDKDGGLPSRANAFLIAAAPDLLAACRLAKEYLVPDLIEPDRAVFWKLVDAIAKASPP